MPVTALKIFYLVRLTKFFRLNVGLIIKQIDTKQ